MTAVACSFVLGLAVGLGRLYGPFWLRIPLVFYIDSMRAIPVFVVLVWIYFAVPILTGHSFAPFWAALVGITFHVAAYVAEVIRAGINSIRKGQTEAGLAIGMSRTQVFLQIILPQAWRRVPPVLASTWVSLFKDTSLVSVIAVGELAHKAMQIRSQSFRVLEMLTAMGAIYWLMGYPQAKLTDWIQRRYGVRE